MTDGKEAMFRRVERRATVHMQHGYLARRKVRQEMSRFHFEVGYAITTAAEVEDAIAESVLTACLLLWQGLSIHDEVDTCEPEQQGLVVLAGDYDSSKYYYILSELGDSALLYALSEAVVLINEAKMTLTTEASRLSSSDYMRLMKVVEGQLLKALAMYYLGKNSTWMTYIDSLVQAHIVRDELLVRRVKRNFTVRQASEWLENSIEQIETGISTTPSGPLYRFMVEYFAPIQETVRHLHLAEGKG